MIFISAPLLAYAAGVSNLSGAPKKIEVDSAEGFKPVIIAAGETYSSTGKLKIRYKNHEFFLEEFEEYAIWNDGTLGPQRRMQDKRARSSGFR